MLDTGFPFPEFIDPVREFEKHLNISYNRRILFSGRFGTGKSTFLQKFFLNNEKYTLLTLNPINYSVANSEDVFELIKFDLLSQLLAQHRGKIEVNDNHFTLVEALLTHGYYSLYHSKNLLKALFPFFKPAEDLATKKYPIIGTIVSIIEKVFKSIRAEIERIRRDEGSISHEFTKWAEVQKGSVNEKDEITFLLLKYIRNLKVNSGTEIVLLVDDLDRLDPEHTFRLFNIFSAHYKPGSDENKFNVDKIIFVCHYRNIKQMYRHRYGRGVDFIGYMDKFFTTKVFHFRNHRQRVEYMKTHFMALKRDTNLYTEYGYPNRPEFPQGNDNNFLSIAEALGLLVVDLIALKLITLRDVSKLKEMTVPSITAKIHNKNYSYRILHFLVLMYQLKEIIPLEKYLNFMPKLKEHCRREYISKRGGLGSSIDRFMVGWTLLFVIDINQIKPFEGFDRFNEKIGESNYTFTFKRDGESIIPNSISLETLSKDTHPFYDFIEVSLKLCIEAKLFDQ